LTIRGRLAQLAQSLQDPAPFSRQVILFFYVAVYAIIQVSFELDLNSPPLRYKRAEGEERPHDYGNSKLAPCPIENYQCDARRQANDIEC
jgi:hypothetical protein